jgi:hypothetical protein
VTAFFEDMKRRGLNDPLLVTSDGAPGIINWENTSTRPIGRCPTAV